MDLPQYTEDQVAIDTVRFFAQIGAEKRRIINGELHDYPLK